MVGVLGKALRIGGAGVIAVLALAAAGPSQAALVIDDFLINNGMTPYFPTVAAVAGTPAGAVATGFHTTPGVVGGERDVRVAVTNTVVYAGDNGFGVLSAGAGTTNGFQAMGISIDFAAEGDFLLQYDGADGDLGLGAGLDLDVAAAGDRIALSGLYNQFLVGNALAPTNLVIRLTDMSGDSAALTRTLSAGLVGFQTLTWGFADFEAANGQLDLRHIKAIELSGVVRNELPLTGFLNLTGFGVFGDAYTPGNGTDGAAVPEPSAWALMIAGLGLTGAALRRRALA